MRLLLDRLRRTFKRVIFSVLRPLFVEDLDANEDFACIVCDEPVLRRHLTCGQCEVP